MKKLLSLLLSLCLVVGAAPMAYADQMESKTITIKSVPQDIAGHWAQESIAKAAGLELMKGVSNTQFAPNKTVTREELAAIVNRLAGDPEVSSILSYQDTKGRWSQQAIVAAVTSGLMKPISENKFAPTQNASRELVALTIKNAMDLKGIAPKSATASFTDISKSANQGAIAQMSAYKIMGGYQDNSFGPSKSVTRAELASILVRAYQVMNNVQIELIKSAQHPQTLAAPKKPATAVTGNKVTYPTKTGTATVNGVFHPDYGQKVLDLVNNHRTKAGLNKLSWGDDLQSGTDVRAAEISALFSHTRPNGSQWHTVGTPTRGENIASFYATPEDVVKGWMNSPEHRQNIMNPRWTEMTVSVFEKDSNKQDQIHWAQHFS